MNQFTKPVVTIDYAEYQELLSNSAKLEEGSSISGLTPDEYGEACILLLERALQAPQVFRNAGSFILGTKYEAKLEMKTLGTSDQPLRTIQFRKI